MTPANHVSMESSDVEMTPAIGGRKKKKCSKKRTKKNLICYRGKKKKLKKLGKITKKLNIRLTKCSKTRLEKWNNKKNKKKRNITRRHYKKK